MCSSCFIGKAKSQSHFYFSTYLSVPFRRKKEQSKRGTGRKSEKELERESGRKAEGGLDVRWLCCGAEYDDDDDQSDDDYSLLSLSLFHDDDDHGVDVGHKDIVLSNSYARLFCCIFIST